MTAAITIRTSDRAAARIRKSAQHGPLFGPRPEHQRQRSRIPSHFAEIRRNTRSQCNPGTGVVSRGGAAIGDRSARKEVVRRDIQLVRATSAVTFDENCRTAGTRGGEALLTAECRYCSMRMDVEGIRRRQSSDAEGGQTSCHCVCTRRHSLSKEVPCHVLPLRLRLAPV